MASGASCSVEALHLDGSPIPLRPYRGAKRHAGRTCGDCGVRRGGYHHPGCDLQACPLCRGQLLTCGCPFDEHRDASAPMEVTVRSGGPPLFGGRSEVVPLGVDANGAPVELHHVDGMEVIVHIDDIPDCDVAVLHGIPCTTALRTVIDLAADLDRDALRRMVDDALDRGLFTVEEAIERVSRPDLQRRPGAVAVRELLSG